MESNIHCLCLELINYFFVHQSDDLAKKIESDPMENKWQSPVKIGTPTLSYSTTSSKSDHLPISV